MKPLIFLALAIWRASAPPALQRRRKAGRSCWGHPGRDLNSIRVKAIKQEADSRNGRRLKICH